MNRYEFWARTIFNIVVITVGVIFGLALLCILTSKFSRYCFICCKQTNGDILMDYSQISCYSACPRKYRNKYILRLEKLAYEEQDVPKEFGKCIHKALEIRDKEGLEEGGCLF